ncbi:MAG: hypothetical protein M1834_009542 [Cirrosporium novae-zelandiae]|nr:MAG: hypothetical protein M1834_009542 [Cirrosporium novae-zelandiae]
MTESSQPEKIPKVSEGEEPEAQDASASTTTTTTSTYAESLDVDVDGDHDSALGDEVSTYTASLTSEALNYRYEYGRRYHGYKDGSYPLPNDEQEIERLDVQHRLWLLTLEGKLHMAPLPEDVQDVLDVATGTGTWCIDFADQHPSARILGTDLSPIQPTLVPPNCTFIVDDSEAPWAFSQKFDFIHSRAIVFGWHDWPSFFRQAFQNLKPGGYLECQDWKCDCIDAEGVPRRDNARMQGCDYMIEAARTVGIDLEATDRWEELVREAGFEDVHMMNIAWPDRPDTVPNGDQRVSEMGRIQSWNFMQGIQGMSLRLLTGLGWSRERVEVFLAQARKDYLDPNVRAFTPITIMWARRPE